MIYFPLTKKKHTHSQIQIFSFARGSGAMETLYSAVRSALGPILRSYSKSSAKEAAAAQLPSQQQSQQQSGLDAVQRKLAELERSLYNAKQSVDIEEVRFPHHAVVARALQAAEQQGRLLTADDPQFAQIGQDTGFLNELQTVVNGWTRLVQRVTKLERVEQMPQGSSVMQEIKFWEELELELTRIEDQLRSPACQTSFALLKRAKRFHATQPFDTDTIGLRACIEVAKQYKGLTRGFPADSVGAASDLVQLAAGIRAVFDHLRKSEKSSQYPFARYIRLAEALSRDMIGKVREILAARSLLSLPYEGYMQEINGPFHALFKTWEAEFQTFKDVLRKIRDRQGQDRLPFKFEIQHQDLIDRVNAITSFRSQHEELVRVVKETLSGDVEEIVQAYSDAMMTQMDLTDTTAEGVNRWKDLLHAYNLRIDRVESRIVTSLRSALSAAQKASDMFAVFAKFNALFVRPRIRGAISEYQDVLIEQVATDIEQLASCLRSGYGASLERQMDQLRDIPPTAGHIVWARQMATQLEGLMRRVEDVLGPSWALNVHGKKLKQDGDNLRDKLKTDRMFNEWVEDTNRALAQFATGSDHLVSSLVFSILKRGQNHILSVAFDERLIVLFKEVRNLVWLGFHVPMPIALLSTGVRQVYPHVVTLRQLVRTYNQCVSDITEGARPLVQAPHKAVQAVISGAIKLRWNALSKLQPLVASLSAAVGAFKASLTQALEATAAVDAAIEQLRTCPYNRDTFRKHVAEIQKQADALDLAKHSNLHSWAQGVRTRVEDALVEQLNRALTAYCAALDEQKTEGAPQVSLAECKFSIVVRNGTMVLEPSLLEARVQLMEQLTQCMQIVVTLPALQAGRYSLGSSSDVSGGATGASNINNKNNISSSTHNADYSGLLARVPPQTLTRVYSLIEHKVAAATSYVQQWLRYQGLWDMDASLYAMIGEDLAQWQALLLQLKDARQLFEGSSAAGSSSTTNSLYPIRIDIESVKASVSNKYDFWHRDILHHYGERVAHDMRAFHEKISRLRQDLEGRSVQHDTAEGAVDFVIHLQDVQRQQGEWKSQVAAFGDAQATLRKHRWTFPADWIPFEMVEAEWAALVELLNRRQQALEQRIPILSQEILKEVQATEGQVSTLLKEWESEGRPKGKASAQVALHALGVYGTRAAQMQERWVRLQSARHALAGEAVPPTEQLRHTGLSGLAEECVELREVWTLLAGVWKSLAEVGQQGWGGVIPRRVRTALDDLLQGLRSMPAKVKQYEAFELLQATIKGLLDCNGIIVDLKSEALRDRHWNELRKRLRAKWVWGSGDLTLQDIWDSDLKTNGNVFKDIIVQAQGEMALEVFLQQVREHWESTNLDLVTYRGKCSLIRGWDDLFQKLTDHINSLNAMKMSPYYRVFEAEAQSWDEKLNKLFALLDIWIDVQRRWVYLEGIFSSSAEIAVLLPLESQRFRSINGEFLALMRKTAAQPNVLMVASIEGAHRGLEKLLDLLTKIQKALGEYLEKQRAAFPRFYFVGDEDLLEIIGAGKDVTKIQKHFKKMFAGVAAVEISLTPATAADAEEGGASSAALAAAASGGDGKIVAILSGEGERLALPEPFSTGTLKINEWLTRLELQSRLAVSHAVQEALKTLRSAWPKNAAPEAASLLAWLTASPAQAAVLALQIAWTEDVEQSIAAKTLPQLVSRLDASLAILASNVLGDLTAVLRSKHEHVIGDLVHQRDVSRRLVSAQVDSLESFDWLTELRFYWDEKQADPLKRCVARMANAEFLYGWEYLGVGERLVQTPLTDRCYLTLTQALHDRFGGSPAGPAGTGKTETVKALGSALGRFTLVFCCDENFDFQAMGRIFVGLCETGSWGCFDEFNRLEERILSAVSQQIQLIQEGLRAGAAKITLSERSVNVGEGTGIFITMNPGYAGRVELPDNLKQLFRPIAMVRPDLVLIAQVMLFCQGYGFAERLAHKVVPLFELMKEQLSQQSHYDWGLRALKTVLVSAGNLKRRLGAKKRSDAAGSSGASTSEEEEVILIRSIWETVAPKLLQEDIVLFRSLVQDVFPGAKAVEDDHGALRAELLRVTKEQWLVEAEPFMHKIMQLHQTLELRHGVMMVGPSGSGKSTALRVLSEALTRHSGIPHQVYTVDAKAMHKDQLYGNLDSTTREWTDGLFTHILRRIIENVRGEANKVHWIVFDGDVDPEWVENLNSLLDDNKLLTLPNGERLALPHNVRILFEVDSLRSATPATVSRCGMIWFSGAIVTPVMTAQQYLKKLKELPLDAVEAATLESGRGGGGAGGVDAAASKPAAAAAAVPPGLALQRLVERALWPLILEGEEAAPGALEEGPVLRILSKALEWPHIMDMTATQMLNSLFHLIDASCVSMQQRNVQRPDFPLTAEQISGHARRHLCSSLLWAFGGSLLDRTSHALELAKMIGAQLGAICGEVPTPLEEHFADMEDGVWRPWAEKVPAVEIETHQAASPDVVIPTVDTVRHRDLIAALLARRAPLILCGPPGSGKTMTLFSTLHSLPDVEVVTLNFSSATTPELLLSTFAHHCEYRVTPKGPVLRPNAAGKWLVLFCDEINLPAPDRYGTQRVITFLRQLTERQGFWRTTDQQWVHLERIQFVGACNPPTDPGRVPLPLRFLRYAPVILVGFPTRPSLQAIYGTMTRALLKLVPEMRNYADATTQAMLDVYTACQKRFTPDMQAHYIFSPRELSRWVRSLHSALQTADTITLDGLVRLWLHEGLRLFQDRLVEPEERDWMDQCIDAVARERFPALKDVDAVLARPVLYSSWTSTKYVPVHRNELRDYVRARLKVFYEEELDVPLVLFNEVLDHILRIDRVFRQPQGHALLIGVSGGGKTVLSRFVAWLNGLTVFTIKVNSRYGFEDFRADLRKVMVAAGAHDEKMCFIFDESNVLDSNFLELMNTLLASGDVPGLFEGDDLTQLLGACREACSKRGIVVDQDDLYTWFVSQVRLNLHVVFTMNPASPDFHNRSATSPALFNRCVLDWFGDWSETALFQVAQDFTRMLDLDEPAYAPPVNSVPSGLVPLIASAANVAHHEAVITHRDAAIYSLVHMHSSVRVANKTLLQRTGRSNYLTPRHFLDLIRQVVGLVNEKRHELEEQQLHLNVGLRKLRETEGEVSRLQEQLGTKRIALEAKDKQANEKLLQMVGDQQEAERKRQESIALQARLKVQDEEISAKKAVAERDLAKAEPAVEEAKKSVSSIQKAHLDELRALRKPPAMIQRVLEAVCMMLGHGKLDWERVRKVLTDQGFIPQIVGFDSKAIPAAVRAELSAQYLSDETFNFENANKASKACGPLVKWLVAQVEFSEILNRVAPLREEVARLEEAASVVKKQATELHDTIAHLEAHIATLKEEYATLIRETEAIKSELDVVGKKVERSVSLLTNLASESTRWGEQAQSFQEQMSTIVGDCLLSSGFLSYVGVFDQQLRAHLLSDWKSQLDALGIRYRESISCVDYLALASQRLEWRNHALPPDELCVENAVMLTRFHRYPLVIDPSGQATTFLLNMLASRKAIKTSFLDSSFQKNLESALRFGCPIVVEDVENMDPILNPILNRETRKAGGRVLIRLGDQDIDFSPSFVIYMTTRDPSAHFTPDLCSRVTLINFTITHAGLTAQCLSAIMRQERADVEERRGDALRQQGEFRVALRAKEAALLDCISKAQGNLLQSDTVVVELEKLKSDASAIAEKVAASEGIMEEIVRVSQEYEPTAQRAADLYFAVTQLSSLHFLYQTSLQHFQSAFETSLKVGSDIVGSAARTTEMERRLYATVHERSLQSLLSMHRVALSLRLALCWLSGGRGGAKMPPAQEVDYVLGAQITPVLAAGEVRAPWAPAWLSEAQGRMVSAAAKLYPALQQILTQQQQQVGNEEQPWLEKLDPWTALCVCKSVWPHRVEWAAIRFVESVMGAGWAVLPPLDAKRTLVDEVGPGVPVVLIGTQGHDPARVVDELAHQLQINPYHRIAIGSAEGFAAADKSVTSCFKSGGWVLLRNVHLAPQWLQNLEKRLHNMGAPKSGFRLFLTSDAHPSLPPALLRMARVLTFEQPPGLRSSLLHALHQCPATIDAPQPVERSRLHLLVCWLHAVLNERLRYVPLGWSKKSIALAQSDLLVALSTVDVWVDRVARGRQNIDPAKLPWHALRSLLGSVVYGGRVDNAVDQRMLDSFVTMVLDAVQYVEGSKLGGILLPAPTERTRAQLLKWAESLPEGPTDPRVLGLPQGAEQLVRVRAGQESLAAVAVLMQGAGGGSSVAIETTTAAVADNAAHENYGTGTQAQRVEQWLQRLKALPEPVVNKASDEGPLARFWAREALGALKLKKRVTADLRAFLDVAQGASKSTNATRALLADLQANRVPSAWRSAYSVSVAMPVTSWMEDALVRLGEAGKAHPVMGRLFAPSSYVTATRQQSCAVKGWALEGVVLEAKLLDGGANSASAGSWLVTGMHVEGAKWNGNFLELCTDTSHPLPPLELCWTPSADAKTVGRGVYVPCYLNSDRNEVLFSVWVASQEGVPASQYYLSGLAFVASSY